MQFYSDPALSVPFGSEISLALRESLSYQYHYPIQGMGAGSAVTGAATFTVGGVTLLPPITGTFTYTEAADAVAIVGTVGASNTGTFTYTEAPDTISITGAVAGVSNTGTFVYTEAADIVHITGTIPNPTVTETFSIYARDEFGNLQTGLSVSMTAFLDAGDIQYDFTNKVFNNASSTLPLIATTRTGQYAASADVSIWSGWINLHVSYSYVDSSGQTRIVSYDVPVYYTGGVRVGSSTLSTVAIPTAQDIATAVLSSASSTPIAANIKKVNDSTVTGSGTSTVPWGPV